MATLNIRNLPDEVHRRLRIRAAEHGRSMEAEARAILCDAVTGDRQLDDPLQRATRLQAFVDKLYGGNKPQNVVGELIAERRREAAREEQEQCRVGASVMVPDASALLALLFGEPGHETVAMAADDACVPP